MMNMTHALHWSHAYLVKMLRRYYTSLQKKHKICTSFFFAIELNTFVEELCLDGVIVILKII